MSGIHEYIGELLDAHDNESDRRRRDRRGKGRDVSLFEEMWVAANGERRQGDRRS